MKIIFLPIALPFLLITMIFSSCSIGADAEEAQSYVEEFYGYLSEKEYDKALDMVDEESFAIDSKEDWMAVFTQKEKLGKFEGYEKGLGFNTKYNNGVTTVELNYTCTYEKFKVYEHFTLVKRGDEYKIRRYKYNTDKS